MPECTAKLKKDVDAVVVVEVRVCAIQRRRRRRQNFFSFFSLVRSSLRTFSDRHFTPPPTLILWIPSSWWSSLTLAPLHVNFQKMFSLCCCYGCCCYGCCCKKISVLKWWSKILGALENSVPQTLVAAQLSKSSRVRETLLVVVHKQRGYRSWPHGIASEIDSFWSWIGHYGKILPSIGQTFVYLVIFFTKHQWFDKSAPWINYGGGKPLESYVFSFHLRTLWHGQDCCILSHTKSIILNQVS